MTFIEDFFLIFSKTNQPILRNQTTNKGINMALTLDITSNFKFSPEIFFYTLAGVEWAK